jgi:hypothetical protein
MRRARRRDRVTAVIAWTLLIGASLFVGFVVWSLVTLAFSLFGQFSA